MKPEWREFLRHRSKNDKIGVALDCEVASVGVFNIVTELVQEGIIVWVDRAVLTHLGIQRKSDDKVVRVGVNTDVYQLTLKGLRLCKEHGVERQ